MRTLSPRVAVGLVVITMLTVGACSSDDNQPASATSETSEAPGSTSTTIATATGNESSVASEILFVVQGRHGTAEQAGDAWTLTIDVGDAPVVWFTDRPLRRSSRLSAEAFVAEWVRNGFADDPPNAALTGVSGATTFDVVVELQEPEWNDADGTLAFAATPLDPEATLPAAFDEASLFVDAAQNTINLNITNLTQVPLQIQSASPDISTWTSPQSPDIGFDFGEGSANGTSLSIGYTDPTPGVPIVAQFILVGDYQNEWQLTVQWDGNGNPKATIEKFSGSGVAVMGEQIEAGVPVVLQNLNPDYGQTANYQVVFVR